MKRNSPSGSSKRKLRLPKLRIDNPKVGNMSSVLAALCNIAMLYVVYFLLRVVYVWENWDIYGSGWSELNKWSLLRGGFRFDTAAIAYTNIIYAILMFLPLFIRHREWWQTMTKWIYVVVNSFAVVINLSDAVYSQFTGHRTTNTFFREFTNDSNLGSVFLHGLVSHWYLLIVGGLLIAGMIIFYVKPGVDNRFSPENVKALDKIGKRRFYISNGVVFLFLFPVTVVAIRGGVINTYRPLNISNAAQYVNQPSQSSIVLNTTYTLIRTLGKTTFKDPNYFSEEKMNALYTPIHKPQTESVDAAYYGMFKGKNVVVIILESFGQEYTGFYNNDPAFADSPFRIAGYEGYTPFLDSLLRHSLTWQQTYANGRKSIEATPSLLTSIPMFVEPFYATGYSLNKLKGLAGLLEKDGYSSAFFHGANNGSMNFETFSRAAGFQNYYGRTEYESDKELGGTGDFDGLWAIWDEPFLQYYAKKMSMMQQPFVTAVFTATSHDPFNIPDQYKSVYPEGPLPIHKCIRYTDNALRRFFETASQQPWFDNTIFIISADHTNKSNHDVFTTPMGFYCIPLLIYDPSGKLPTGVMPGVAQQIDMMPTVLNLLGYDKPYLAFGQDMLGTPPEKTWAVNYTNGVYQFLMDNTLIQFDGDGVVGTYNLHNDPYTSSKLSSTLQGSVDLLKAIIQQYMRRMINDRLIAEEE